MSETEVPFTKTALRAEVRRLREESARWKDLCSNRAIEVERLRAIVTDLASVDIYDVFSVGHLHDRAVEATR